MVTSFNSSGQVIINRQEKQVAHQAIAAQEEEVDDGEEEEEVTIEYSLVQQMDEARMNNYHPTTRHLKEEEASDDDEGKQQFFQSPTSQEDDDDESHATTPSQQQSSSSQPHNNNNTVQQHHHSPLTKVNGKGLWRSWKRNFNSKLMALMDLIDNSLDAAVVVAANKNKRKAINHEKNFSNDSDDDDNDSYSDDDDDGFVGRVHVYPDVYPHHHHHNNNTTNNTITTGIILINNSQKSIRPLQSILEVYNSSKTYSGSAHIGENGVGLKQGAATLSDLTFVLVKKKWKKGGRNDDSNDSMDESSEEDEEGVIELGLIAESLQREEGCCLPAFTFRISNDGGKKDMTNLLSDPHNEQVAACVAKYGSGSFERGINRLSNHFRTLCFGDTFGNDDNVFALILDRVDYGHTATTEIKCFELLTDLRKEIPRFYLHVPSTFDFRIGRGAVAFHYWQQRLVELSSVSLLMNHSSYWHEDKPETDPGAYKLRVLIGFDRFRINNQSSGKEGSLYIYSRESGRLIKAMPDGRGYLRLQNTGSMYCQGLTVIIDDIGGQLPLNPTKQSIAFAEQTNGGIHEENLITLVGALVKVYFDHHLNKYKNRTRLTQMVKDFGDDPVEVDNMKDIDSSEFTTFEYGVTPWVKDGKTLLRIDKKVNLKVKTGRDTRFLLIPPRTPSPPAQEVQEVVAARRDDHQSGRQKRRAHEISEARIEAAALHAASILNNTVDRRGQPAAGMNGNNNAARQLAVRFKPLIGPTVHRNELPQQWRQTQSVLNQSSIRPTEASNIAQTLDHSNATQQNTPQHEQQPISHQPLFNHQLFRQSQSQSPSNPSGQSRVSAGEEHYKHQCKKLIGQLSERDAKIQSLETEKKQLMDIIREKDEQVKRLEAQTTNLKHQIIAIVQNRAEVETSEMI